MGTRHNPPRNAFSLNKEKAPALALRNGVMVYYGPQGHGFA